ncbi:MAG: hypothetical protein A2289_20985 [Deltaproteobacteria bacterium RIFOXYA12_FULL_58_15]|nr:MAG: hypothetical protein A2289_20985 [Deltaproteobacteria bacterium RIFOXYA12_FULL_58_15]
MKDIVAKIAAMLHNDAPEKRIAAAIVLGEIGVKNAAVTKGLVTMLNSDDPPLQKRTLDALVKIGVGQSMDAVFDLLDSHDPDVREASAWALASMGSAVLPEVKRRLVDATGNIKRGVDRARTIRSALAPHAASLTKSQHADLLQSAVDALAKGERGLEAPLQILRDASPKALAEGLRGVATRLIKGRKLDQATTVARLLCRSDQTTGDDRYLLAKLELLAGRHDTHPAARSRDNALRALEQLAKSGFDVSKALLGDQLIDLETKYYIGFHFVEEGHPLGEDLLADVSKKAARSKIGKMAKNKLALAAND